MSSDSDEVKEISAAILHSPLSDKFIRSGSPVLTSGEIRPTNIVPVIAPDRKGNAAAFPMKWGFQIPGGSFIVNARVETAATKPTFREAWGRHRCIIPASWYFEWIHVKNPSGRKVTGDKYMIQPSGSTMTWLAGLYRLEEDGLPYFTVLTREATEELAYIHDRMPLTLPKNRIHDWISPNIKPESVLPYAVTDMAVERT